MSWDARTCCVIWQGRISVKPCGCWIPCIVRFRLRAKCVCVFGIVEGATSALLPNEIRSSCRTLWLFDSSEGLSRLTVEDELIHDMFDRGTIEAHARKIKNATYRKSQDDWHRWTFRKSELAGNSGHYWQRDGVRSWPYACWAESSGGPRLCTAS